MRRSYPETRRVRSQRGSVAGELLAVVVVLALGAASGFAAMGASFSFAIAGDPEPSPAAVSTGAALASAALHAVDDLATASAGPARVAAQTSSLRWHVRHAADTLLLALARPIARAVKGAAFHSDFDGWHSRLVGPERWIYTAAFRAAERRLGLHHLDIHDSLATHAVHELRPREIDALGAHIRAVPEHQVSGLVGRLERIERGRLREVTLESDLFERIAQNRITFEPDHVLDSRGALWKRNSPITEADELFRWRYDRLLSSGGKGPDGEWSFRFSVPTEGHVRGMAYEDEAKLRALIERLAPDAERLGIRIDRAEELGRVYVTVPGSAFRAAR